MSRIGQQPITIPSSVSVTIEKGGDYGNQIVTVKGPKGELAESIRHGISVEFNTESNEVTLTRKNDSKQNKAFHGLYRSLIDSMVQGVTEGFSKVLEIHGVGYRAKVVGKQLELSLGLNHPILFDIPDGIEITVVKDIDITVGGIDKQLVGHVAAVIRDYRKPEPYKGKGIRYQGEYVRRKVGKTAAK
ncbi:50S ribosomal protein L6 [Candidatus Dojkabacteria bacterium]|uniref:Large ribosomal subunit protein uL6 n=1 Tax=Candidatus Dojkabacteria bacterium TaxID=2099670 RepID=A0A955RKF5_9BACT|nr:50S ribosomal protein L6 [Candidatus Dojkabacteria bacterium]